MGYIANQLVRTGKLNQPVKTEPLPPGVYWIDVYDTEENDANIATFHDWIELNKATVRVLRTEVHDTGETWFQEFPWAGVLSLLLAKKIVGIWTLFEVTAPTNWFQQLSLGWPNEGQKGQNARDTIQAPDPEPTIFDKEWGSESTWIPWAVGGGVVVLGLMAIVALRR